MVDEPLFYSMDGATFGKDLLKVLCRIAREKGRVEVTNCEGHNCVIISKEELDSIESALEILSNLNEVQVIHDKVKHVLTLDDETQPVPEVRMEALEQAG
jgi:PHD/YefM family antitoxin component YafN of YafNO toxin-antitoxin module